MMMMVLIMRMMVHAVPLAHSMYTVIKTCRHQLANLEVDYLYPSILVVADVVVVVGGDDGFDCEKDGLRLPCDI